MNCPNCGAELQPGQTFCTSCGTQIAQAQPQYAQPQQAYAAPKKPTDIVSIFKWIILGVGAFQLLSMFLSCVAVKGKYKDEFKAALALVKGFGGSTKDLPKLSYSITSFLSADTEGKGFATFNFVVALLVTLCTAFILFLMLMVLLGKSNPVPAVPVRADNFALWGVIVGGAKLVETFFSPVSILGVEGFDEFYTMSFLGVFKILLSIGIIVLSVLLMTTFKDKSANNPTNGF
ncbi:MAG: zinc ribbon domain-containing protein [Ruminococcus sp.]|nr:zinc ribbon domain-containing protein [Ruminococcus sp.]